MEIKYFMWGYQPHFRIAVNVAVEGAFREIGFQAEAEAFLVGFLADGEEGWPICIEPEDGPFPPNQFETVQPTADEMYAADPESGVLHSHPIAHENFHGRLRSQARARALATRLEELDPTRRFFVGGWARVGKYEVHTVVAVDAAMFDSVPSLRTAERDRIHVDRSLLDAAIAELLTQSGLGLLRQEPGAYSRDVGEPDEIVRRAARNLVDSTVVLVGQLGGGRLYSSLNELATARYERQESSGAVLLCQPDHPQVEICLRLPDPVSLTEGRALRKLLQATTADVHLLTDGRVVYGLGSLGADYDGEAEDAFRFDVLGEGLWELSHASIPLMRVRFGRPTLPASQLDQTRFVDAVERLFAAAGGANAQTLWRLASTASDEAHGTMLVISSGAAAEAERLGGQAFKVDPAGLDAPTLVGITRTDGAVLLSPDGTCHAFGVILDGPATDEGDRARGARYNSAVRYLHATEYPTAIVLVSDDGMINLLPELMPLIDRQILERALADVVELGRSDEPNYEAFYRAWDRLARLAFYLSADGCRMANEVRHAFEDRRFKETGTAIGFRDLAPNPVMDESFFR